MSERNFVQFCGLEHKSGSECCISMRDLPKFLPPVQHQSVEQFYMHVVEHIGLQHSCLSNRLVESDDIVQRIAPMP